MKEKISPLMDNQGYDFAVAYMVEEKEFVGETVLASEWSIGPSRAWMTRSRGWRKWGRESGSTASCYGILTWS